MMHKLKVNVDSYCLFSFFSPYYFVVYNMVVLSLPSFVCINLFENHFAVNNTRMSYVINNGAELKRFCR